MWNNVEAWGVIALVLITAYYAWQTRQTVQAMRESTAATVAATERSIRAQQLPRLALQVYSSGDHQAGVQISNLGGPALEADLTIRFVPHTHRNLQPTVRRHRFPIIDQPRQIMVAGPEKPGGEEGETIPRKELCQDYDRIVVEGQITDSLGERHDVEEAIEDLRPFVEEGSELVTIEDPQTLDVRMTRVHYFAISRELRRLREAVEKGLPPPPPSDIDVF